MGGGQGWRQSGLASPILYAQGTQHRRIRCIMSSTVERKACVCPQHRAARGSISSNLIWNINFIKSCTVLSYFLLLLFLFILHDDHSFPSHSLPPTSHQPPPSSPPLSFFRKGQASHGEFILFVCIQVCVYVSVLRWICTQECKCPQRTGIWDPWSRSYRQL